MKLLTAAEAKKLPELYSTEKLPEKVAIVKYFNPMGHGTWYGVEASAMLDNGAEVPVYCERDKKPKLPGDTYWLYGHPTPYKVVDIQFFGLVDLFEREWGYFSLKELMEVRLPFGLKIERDLYFKPEVVK